MSKKTNEEVIEDMREECRQRIYKAIELIDIERRALVDRLGELPSADVSTIVQLNAVLPKI